MPSKRIASPSIIFVSFASPDILMATEFRNRLQRIAGDDVICFLAPKSIDAGEVWPSEVEQHLTGAACIVILVSESALESTWVLFEAGVGRGRGASVIPITFAGFNIDRQKPPLSFLQAVDVATVNDLNGVLERIAKSIKRNFAKRFSASDLAAITEKAIWRSNSSKTIPLLTRRAVFEEAARLVEMCHINSAVRGVSSLVDTKDKPDRHMTRFDEAVKEEISNRDQ